jgi:hypothetical protein
MVENAVVVDVGTLLTSTCSFCESKQPMIFVVGDCIAKMNTMYEHGIEYFHCVELEKRSAEAALIMCQALKPLQDEVDASKLELDAATGLKTLS